SNISGTFAVASLVSFRNGRPDRANYRRFRIKGVEGQDDFASVAEVVRRRYTRLLNESKVQNPKPKVGAEESGVEGELNRLNEVNKETGKDHSDTARHLGGEAVAQELQQMVDDVSAAAQGKGSRNVNSDASAADVRAGRAA